MQEQNINSQNAPSNTAQDTFSKLHFLTEQNALLLFHAFVMCGLITGRIFVGAFIFKSTGGLTQVGVYYITFFISAFIGFFCIARQSKEKGALVFYKSSFLLLTLFFVAFGTLQYQLSPFIIPVAILYGIAASFYFLPYHQYIVMFTLPQNRGLLVSKVYMIMQILGLALPISFGWLITHSESYRPAAYSAAAISFVGYLLASKIFEERTNEQRPRFNLGKMIAFSREHADLKNLYLAMSMVGLSLWGALDMLVPLLIYYVTRSELILGIIASTLPIIEIISSAISGKISISKHREVIIKAAALLCSASLILGLTFNTFSAIAFAVVVSISSPVISIILNVFAYNIIHKYPFIESHQIEYSVVREFSMLTGRVIAYTLVIAISLLGDKDSVLRLVIPVYGCAALLLAFFVRRVQVPQQAYDNSRVQTGELSLSD